MKELWLFTILVLFCVYVLYGLYLTEGKTDFIDIVLTWLVYTILWVTILNVFALGYFWSVVKDKNGPPGLRGPSGERGKVGEEGQCSMSAASAFLLKNINEFIDALYKAKTNNNILDQDTQTFPNRYLNNKIRTMIDSKQYQSVISSMTNDNKSLDSIINYFKSIFKIWFDLIYNATSEQGIWFNDEFGDEEYNWSGSNPFDEIKKYDIYYWGVTQDFRPIKAEICRTTDKYDSSKIPEDSTNIAPRLKIIQTNDYRGLGTDNETRGIPDASFWRAKPVIIGNDTYYPMGDIITSGPRGIVWKNNFGKKKTTVDKMEYDIESKGPTMRTILVAGDVRDPISAETVGKTSGDDKITNKKLKCPKGYTSLGDSFETRFSNFQKDLKCVPSKCVEKIDKKSYNTWSGGRVGSKHYVLSDYKTKNDDANDENAYNLYRLNDNEFYKIKKSCLEPVKSQTKEVEPQYGDLGIGWYGHPYKLQPQYSIFTFLGLVPEGLIIHKGTGRRFYIIHYGGEEANIYNVLIYNDENKNFTKALQVDSNKNGSKVQPRVISRNDERQQWKIIIQSNKKLLKLQNLMNGKMLYLGLEPSVGDSQFSTVNINKWKEHPVFKLLNEEQINDGTTFSFVSTFGTNLDIIDNEKKKQ
jgi:hypothetical protein